MTDKWFLQDIEHQLQLRKRPQRAMRLPSTIA
jgi:hypothetical protein